jgi:hypothetical protein
MHARKLHHLWTRLRIIKPWYFFAAAAVCLLIGVFALRANNLKMVELRNVVYEADKSGGDVQAALTKLQRHVTSHMNTDLTTGNSPVYPPIQLKYTYERLRTANLKNTNEQLYIDAQAHCESLNSTDFSGRNRVPCIQQYVESRGVQQKAVPESLYKYDFISPAWSPDLAGYSLLASGLFAITGFSLWLVRRHIRRKVS